MDETTPREIGAADPREYRGNPRPRVTERSERTAQRLLRPVVFLFVMSMGLNAILGVTLYSLFPLTKVQLGLIQFSDKKYYQVDYALGNTSAEAKLREAFARRYVLERETINLVDDRERWFWIRQQSHGRVWNPFIAALEQNGTWRKMEQENLTQEARVLGSWAMRDDPYRWAVEYERIKRRGYDIVERSTWVAQLFLNHRTGKPTDAELFDNPYQLRVDRYTINSKETLQGGE